MSTWVVVQARMSSTRLPGKVLMDLGGVTMLERVVAMAKRAPTDGVLVATSLGSPDDAVVAACDAMGTPVFRGSEDDVLDRYVQAARSVDASVIVRLTSDNALVDPEVVALVLSRFREERPDYASNALTPSFPLGLDVEVMTRDALEAASREATAPYHRAHVTAYLYEHPERFRLLDVRAPEDRSRERWTVDTPEDLAFVRAVLARLGGAAAPHGWREIAALLDREPELRAINQGVRQRAIEEG